MIAAHSGLHLGGNSQETEETTGQGRKGTCFVSDACGDCSKTPGCAKSTNVQSAQNEQVRWASFQMNWSGIFYSGYGGSACSREKSKLRWLKKTFRPMTITSLSGLCLSLESRIKFRLFFCAQSSQGHSSEIPRKWVLAFWEMSFGILEMSFGILKMSFHLLNKVLMLWKWVSAFLS